MFDIRVYQKNFYCKHMPQLTKQQQTPIAFMSFHLIHSLFCAQASEMLDEIAPPPTRLTYESVLTQVEALKCDLQLEKEKALWGVTHPSEVSSLLLSLRWKLFLKCLPTDGTQWTTEIRKHRKAYEDLCIERSSDLVELFEQNPLDSYSSDANLIGPDQDEFVGNDAIKARVSWDIKKDIKRTKLEKRIQTCENRQMLHKILFLYAMKHPEINYTQGFNELIAVLFNVMMNDYMKVNTLLEKQSNSPTNSFLRELFSQQNLEHDVYILFEKLMEGIRVWYETNENESKHILERCDDIVKYLSIKDPHIYQIFCELEVEPQLFLLRWVRILFCQVFNTTDLYYIWDVLFAHDNLLELLNHLCVVVMSLPRETVCSGDGLNVFNIFFNYPRKFPIYFIVHCALNSYTEKNRPLFKELYPLPLRKEKNKRRTPNPSTGELQKELSFDTRNSLDTDGMYTQLVFIEDNLENVLESLPFVSSY
ncbi:hypothetical protein EIN_096710 [Entamoeba invadens IP1]|uniref:Rab-GAP TBC domain-containing protein n=1 Tax=Entamoeba invadens IP1 TaxID=370355 RepID=A0A0A1U0J6_ENTIV|nr:hypothetical protein EIN_096710 [Entamoeba invadens IP1]ELP87404.1 hypothetical protein EIN_096710 [Entamoeba invadens IP1]|eukprot:XP_004254175.1 hypothetical protein EIN_096710 [Entamoeba invadens IP1]